ncbi:hypothetical protein [Roseateles albus]|uniref:Integrase catalytic domain-containing protein n=1 Tax=Roseateles albus TaxID=2987525 RepID=A0ABT5KKQ3_9BURK|nr:hypothetical protein [Roseateles albus]MDC8774517.1 hypothetical protein [Roseateles albus]
MSKARSGRQIVGVTDKPDFDLASWPTADPGALSDKDRKIYLARKLAVELCVAGHSDKQIKTQCGIGLKHTVRLIRERCVLVHADGRIWGFRILVNRLRVVPVSRHKPVRLDSFGRGGVGAMNSLLELDPEFRRSLDSKILKVYKPNQLGELKRPRSALWSWFLTELRQRGYEIRNDWPFNSESLGYLALRRYTDRLLSAHPIVGAKQLGGPDLARKLVAGDGVDRPVMKPFQRVEMDAHKTDGRFCVLMPQADGGWSPKIIHRLWVIVIIEVLTRVVLGYYLSMGREVNKDDILRAIKSAVTRWTAKPISFSDTALAAGAGLPPVLGERYVGIPWEETSVDGALAETCRTVKERLKEVVGSQLIDPSSGYSSRRSKDDRPFIERFFSTLAAGGLQRMTNSTGANTKQRRGRDPDDVAVASRFQYEYLGELLQCLICNYNATQHEALGYRSPLEMLKYYGDRNALPTRQINQDLAQGLLTTRQLCVVHGGFQTGRQPFVNFSGARYGGPNLSNRHDLVGEHVWVINHLEDDARVATCSTQKGQSVGVLRAAPPWHKTPHSLVVRRSISSLVRSKRMNSLGLDAILSFMDFVESQPKKQLPIHPAYLEVRRILAQQAENYEGDRASERALCTLAEKSKADSLTASRGSGPISETTPTLAGETAPTQPKPLKIKVDQRSGLSAKRALPAKRLAAN